MGMMGLMAGLDWAVRWVLLSNSKGCHMLMVPLRVYPVRIRTDSSCVLVEGAVAVAGAVAVVVLLLILADNNNATTTTTNTTNTTTNNNNNIFAPSQIDPGVVEGTDLRVLKYPHPALRAENAEIEVFDDDLKKLAKDMLKVWAVYRRGAGGGGVLICCLP